MTLPAIDFNPNMMRQLSKSLATDSFRDFIPQAWKIVEPATELKMNWHIEAVADHLQACYTRQIVKLIVNVPPGSLKSTLTSVMFQPWVWIQEPSARFLTSSYGAELAVRDSVKSRRLIDSEWYQGNWGDKFEMTSDQNTKSSYENNKTGYRIAMGTGGKATGFRGGYLIIDDAHNVKDILSITEANLNTTIEWWDNAWKSRLNKDGIFIIIMQRLHDKDVVGHELAKGGWEHLLLPQEYEPKRSKVTCIGFVDPRKEEGEYLHSKMFGDGEKKEALKDLKELGYASQHQQRPSPKKGNIFKRSWWKYYRELPHRDEWELFAHSWDTAYKDKEQNDYWGFCSGIKTNNRLYIKGYSRRKMEVPEGERSIKNLYYKDMPDVVLVEDKASGQSIIQFAHQDTDIPMLSVEVSIDKVARANAQSGKVAAGLILLPDPQFVEDTDWVDQFIEDMARFPMGVCKDGTDAFTQLVKHAWIASAGVYVESKDAKVYDKRAGDKGEEPKEKKKQTRYSSNDDDKENVKEDKPAKDDQEKDPAEDDKYFGNDEYEDHFDDAMVERAI